jgi:hypothetical protein
VAVAYVRVDFLGLQTKVLFMRKLLISFGLTVAMVGGVGAGFAPTASAQTKIVFAKGAFSKTTSTTIAPGRGKSYSVSVRSGQVINIDLFGDIAVSKTNSFPTVYVNLNNGEEGVDRWQDGEAYLSILTGNDGKYIFTVTNGSKRSRLVKFKVTITDDINDFLG